MLEENLVTFPHSVFHILKLIRKEFVSVAKKMFPKRYIFDMNKGFYIENKLSNK